MKLEFSLEEIARAVGGKVVGKGRVVVRGLNSLEAAEADELSFFADRRYGADLEKTRAAALMTAEETPLFNGPQIVVRDPALAYARAAVLFAKPIPRFPGASEASFVHESCRLGEDVSIYPAVYVGAEAEIGDHVTLFPGVFIGDRVKIGRRSVIYPNVAILEDSAIGEDVVVHAGTVIGSDGFGFAREGAKSIKIPQIGRVQIDDEVEIGANNCIDRAALGKTWIKRGVKTDNLVHIAHNVVIGENTIVVAQTGISGSCRIGKGVVIAGQVGIVDHVNVGDHAMIGPQSGVAKSIPPGEVVSGTPSMPHRLWLKTSGLIGRLPQFSERMRQLEKKIQTLEARLEEAE